MIQQVSKTNIPEIKKILEKYFGNVIENDPYVFYLTYEDAIIKGILSYSKIYERIEINYLWVDTVYRQKGIATNLLFYLEEIAKNNDIENISLEVECENQNAIQLYQKCGYKIVAKREKYYHGKDGYLMVKVVKK